MSLTWSILLDMDSVMETEWEMLTPAATAASSVSILLPVADVIASVWLSHTHANKM